jgi:phosphatidylglycerophosphate synthase
MTVLSALGRLQVVIDNAFRRILPCFVSPLLALYRRLRLTPNHVTAIGLVIALIASVAVALGANGWAIGFWWVSRLADGTDGIYARESGQVSEFGGYLDIVLDMAAYGAMVLGFAVAEPSLGPQWMAILFLYVLCIASALALGMQEMRLDLPPRDDRGLRLGAGLAEGGETGIAYSVFLLWPSLLPVTTVVWIVILLMTVLARSVLARRTLRPAYGFSPGPEAVRNRDQHGSRSTRPEPAPSRL